MFNFDKSKSGTKLRLSCCCIVAVCASVLLQSPRAQAEQLYTINLLAGSLVQIDPHNGHTATVGPIGYEFHGADLTFMDGALYAVTAHGDGFYADAGYALLKINPATGQLLSSVELSLNGDKPYFVESLAAAGGKLFIGFSPHGTVSTDVGELNPVTGEITHDIDYSAIPGVNTFFGSFGVDLDGMSTDPLHPGSVLGLDTDNQTLISIARIDPTNVTASPVSQFFHNPGGVDDLAVGDEAAYMIGAGNLYVMDLGATGVMHTFGLNPAGSFAGLAVPEPSSVLLAALGVAVLPWFGRRCVRSASYRSGTG